MAVLFLFLFVPFADAYYTGIPASVVVGQPDFVSSSANQGGSTPTANTLSNPIGNSQSGGKLCVVDQGNNRVLIWNSIPTQNNRGADIVLGQPDFVSNTANNGGVSARTLNGPNNCWFGEGEFFVVDVQNRRVLVWNSVPTSNFQAADVVVGQPDFSTTSNGSTQSKISFPFMATTYNGKLFVSDRANNNRVLIWNSIPKTNGVAADVVVGQPDFSTITPGLSATKLKTPRAVVAFDNKLYIDDGGNIRVLIYNSIPTANGAAADVVIGQPDFNTGTADNGGISCAGIGDNIDEIGFNRGRLFFGEKQRILIWNSVPTSNFVPADMVLGQPDCFTRTANYGGLSASSLSGNIRVGGMTDKQMIVSDSDNNRVLIYNNVNVTPAMDITTPLTDIGNGRLEVKGSVQLGNNGTYAMQWVKADINGDGLGYVTNFPGGRSNGDNTLYDFYDDFNPYVRGGSKTNYTLKLVASSFNADTTSLFYFQPFDFKYINKSRIGNNLNIDFFVNSMFLQRVIDNVDHFRIMYKEEKSSVWKVLTDGITTDKISNTGEVYVTAQNKLLSKIKYLVKVVSISKDSNWEQTSNVLSYLVPAKKTR